VWRWYYEIVAKDYCRCSLSISKDKIPAASGLARLVASSTQSHYIARLWEYGLCYGLCWKVNAPAPPQVRRINYRAPSFSWALVESPVNWLPAIFDPNILPSSCLTVLLWQSIPATSDQYGRITSALLEVTGQIKWCKVTPREAGGWPSDAKANILGVRDKHLVFSQAWLDRVTIEESLLIPLVCAVQQELPGNMDWTMYVLLLEPVVGRLEVFGRKGLAALNSSEAYDQTLLPGRYHNTTITII
jgi:hypothetical protein